MSIIGEILSRLVGLNFYIEPISKQLLTVLPLGENYHQTKENIDNHNYSMFMKGAPTDLRLLKVSLMEANAIRLFKTYKIHKGKDMINPSRVLPWLPTEMFGLMNNIKPFIGLGVNQTTIISEMFEKGKINLMKFMNPYEAVYV